MRQETVKIYKFDELSEDAQEKVLNDNRNIEVDYPDWWDHYDCLLEPSKEDRERFDIQGDEWCPIFQYKIGYFDVNYSRGFLQLKDIEVLNKDVFMRLLEIPIWLREYAYYYFKNEENYHKNTTLHIEFDCPEDDEETPEVVEYLEFLADEFFPQAERIFAEMMKEAVSCLHDAFYELMSDECVADCIRANEYEFTADGERW